MIQPLHDYVLLQKEEDAKTTASGIILSSNKEKSKYVKVIAMGQAIQNAGYSVGDRVLYREYAGMDLEEDNEEYILVKDEDIIAVKK